MSAAAGKMPLALGVIASVLFVACGANDEPPTAAASSSTPPSSTSPSDPAPQSSTPAEPSPAADQPDVPVPSFGEQSASVPPSLIPEDVMPLPEPPADPEVRRYREDSPDLPAQLDPCGGDAPGLRDRVAARQLVLVLPAQLWKTERLTIYADRNAAARAMDELRDDLTRCGEHDDADGIRTRWQTTSIPLGDEALFVGGQMYRDGAPIAGHFRGTVMRRDRAVFAAIDFGRSLEAPTVEETAEQQARAVELDRQLRDSSWLTA